MSRSLATATVVQGNRPSRRALPPGLDPARLPSHVAVIMDGNGRWAGQRKLPRVMGHREGVEALKRTLRLCSDWGIGALTAYAFSTENWSRPGEEVSFLMTLFERVLARELEALEREQVRIRFLGDLEQLPEGLQQLISNATARTAASPGSKRSAMASKAFWKHAFAPALSPAVSLFSPTKYQASERCRFWVSASPCSARASSWASDILPLR